MCIDCLLEAIFHIAIYFPTFRRTICALLRPWQERQGTASDQLWACTVEDEEELVEQYFPVSQDETVVPDLQHISRAQQQELLEQMPKGLCSEKPGRTDIIKHDI